MFHGIPAPILARMQHPDRIGSQDRDDGTPRTERLRQIPAATGRFIALLLDAENEIYTQCYEAPVPRMVPGASCWPVALSAIERRSCRCWSVRGR